MKPPSTPSEEAAFVAALALGDECAQRELALGLSARDDWAKRAVHHALEVEAPWAREVFLRGLRGTQAWAMEGFYAWYLPRIERICRFVIQDPIAASDCARDLALVFVDQVVHKERPFETFPGYLWTMVYRRSIRYAQRRRAFSSGPDGDGGRAVHEPRDSKHHEPTLEPPVDVAVHDVRLLRVLSEAVASLDLPSRELLADRHARGHTLDELAARDGVTFQAIAKREQRVLDSLRKTFRKLGLLPPGKP